MSSSLDPKPSSLAEALQSFSPWGSRSNTPRPNEKDAGKSAAAGGSPAASGGIPGAFPVDHKVPQMHRLSFSSYPPDCPELKVQWFHAVDVTKRKPDYNAIGVEEKKKDGKPAPAKKWNPFSNNDSRAVEEAFRRLTTDDDHAEKPDEGGDLGDAKSPDADIGEEAEEPVGSVVPVNEDHLFDVSITRRELRPAYWLGPVYEVRRGTWFYLDSNNLRPCDENLAMQLEEGFLKIKPWVHKAGHQRSQSQSRDAKEMGTVGTEARDGRDGKAGEARSSSQPPPTLLTHRLFGAYMNSTVTFEDATTAWIVSDDFLSRMTGTVYQRFRGGAHLSGTKIVRGWVEPSKKKQPSKDMKRSATPTPEGQVKAMSEGKSNNQSSVPPIATQREEVQTNDKQAEDDSARKPDSRLKTLERQMSTLTALTKEQQEVEAQKREMQEIQEDYIDLDDDIQDRSIDHLILVTHGIGQRLGARFEAFNFIHDVNELRKTMKSVYGRSPDLQALNSETETRLKNNRVQVLPIVWRHKLDFPHQRLKGEKEQHIVDPENEGRPKYPSLEDITIDGVPALRNIMADVALDVLLYKTPVYHNFIAKFVVAECNRIYKLFRERNPSFTGRVSLIGHSLGSAILFDVVSDQEGGRPVLGFLKPQQKVNPDFSLDFPVEDLVCLGSPIGLFQMLNGNTIAGRGNPNSVTLDGEAGEVDDPYTGSSYFKLPFSSSKTEDLQKAISSPKCRALYNIFHPSDPISYRMEPLISQAMAELKPQALPYTKNSFLGAPMGHGITGIPARMGESFSGMWTNLSSTVASSFINRSLGLSAEDAAKLGATEAVTQKRVRARADSDHALSAGAGTNITSGGVISQRFDSPTVQNTLKRTLTQQTEEAMRTGDTPPTLIDGEIETLYAGFTKRRKSNQESDASVRDFGASIEWRGTEAKGRELQREDAKMRLLNPNGRVDYAIQEGAFDVSFISAIASHLAYWTDEDVSHFLLSQLLARGKRRSA